MIPSVNGFQVPNAIIDDYMKDMPDLSFKCYMFIARKTIGWHKEQDAISLSQFQKNGLAPTNRTNLLKALKYLEKNELIAVDRSKNINKYSLVLHKHQASACEAPSASASQAPTINTITINTITKESKRKLLDDEFAIFWESYPRKDAKIQANKAFVKLKQTERQDLIDLLPKVTDNYKTTQKQHIPLPASFINGHRWKDECYLAKKITKRGAGDSLDSNPIEKCIRRFRALSEGEEVILPDVDMAALAALGIDKDAAVEIVNTDGMKVFRSSLQSVWKKVNKGEIK